ncbi:MAG TPA: hypothetical protein VKG44_04070 [Candidatus Baltobacteraceae bacterium]|nr:hypothetical protein [Candidatus Baltobacteraceae bacterium]
MNIKHINDVICKKCGRPGPRKGSVSQIVDDLGVPVNERNPLHPVAMVCECGHETPLFHGSNFTPVTLALAKEGQTVRLIPEA